MNLYQLTNTMQQLQQMLDNEEIDKDVYNDTMELLSHELLSQGTSVKQFIIQNNSNIEQVDAEINRLKEVKTKLERGNDRLKDMILQVMISNNLTRIDTPLGNLSIKYYESVQIDSTEDLPNEYTNQVISVKPDKAKIKSAIKAGKSVTGASLIKNPSLQGV